VANLPRAIASALVRRDNHDNTIIEERRLTSRLSFCDLENLRIGFSDLVRHAIQDDIVE